MIKLDFNKYNTKEELHLYLKQQCQFPDYYGCNLDALYDCLTDDKQSFEIILQEYTEYQKAIIDTIKDAGCEVILKG